MMKAKEKQIWPPNSAIGGERRNGEWQSADEQKHNFINAKFMADGWTAKGGRELIRKRD